VPKASKQTASQVTDMRVLAQSFAALQGADA